MRNRVAKILRTRRCTEQHTVHIRFGRHVLARVLGKLEVIGSCDAFPHSHFTLRMLVALKILDRILKRRCLDFSQHLLERFYAHDQVERQARMTNRTWQNVGELDLFHVLMLSGSAVLRSAFLSTLAMQS